MSLAYSRWTHFGSSLPVPATGAGRSYGGMGGDELRKDPGYLERGFPPAACWSWLGVQGESQAGQVEGGLAPRTPLAGAGQT